ncbi:hypothetical protein ALNOE001_16070 [Candidatus Methanobinarius endosymbioticus]|uniref:Uncharacterized protein n=1 Tax=Candidatus Methanobinarius endosymbioticus TaxID=2006182 RepID=A0A366MA55_9EURY|nr:hypothetical protein ALNOE001_16070 [Candidatus Methanobinarius endosymbioticus]
MIFKENDQMMVYSDKKEDVIHLESNDNFDIQFNDTILINCGIIEFDKLKKVCVGNYKQKKNIA